MPFFIGSSQQPSLPLVITSAPTDVFGTLYRALRHQRDRLSAPLPKDLLTTLIRSYAAAIKSNDQLLVDYASRNLDAHLSRIDITLVEVQDIDANEDGAVGHA